MTQMLTSMVFFTEGVGALIGMLWFGVWPVRICIERVLVKPMNNGK